MTQPWAPADPLGEALHVLRLRGTFYSRCEFTAPWGLALPPRPDTLMEYAAYESLIQEHRHLAARLTATAQEMVGYQDLPMGDATTLVNIVQRVGGAIGAAGLVIVLTQAGCGGPSAYGWAFAILTVIAALTVGLAMILRAQTGARSTP